MKNFCILIILFLLFNFCPLIFAQSSTVYFFNSPEQEQLFTKLTTESRCLVCQNQSLADSDASLAVDLRNIIYDLIKQGKNYQTIQNFLVQRYGDYILLNPPLNKATLILWIFPFLLLGTGLGVLVFWVRRQR